MKAVFRNNNNGSSSAPTQCRNVRNRTSQLSFLVTSLCKPQINLEVIRRIDKIATKFDGNLKRSRVVARVIGNFQRKLKLLAEA